MKTNNSNEEKPFVDDGRTIANMDVEGISKHKRDSKRQREYDVTKEEKRHLILAGYKAALPVLICGLVGMLLAMLLIMAWLK